MSVARRRLGILASLLALVVTGCAGGGSANPARQTDGGSSPTSASITVAAASSLTEVFEQIAADFTAATGVAVRTTYAGSSALAEQIRNGAPIDVFASAGATVMTPLAEEQLVRDVTGFATNSLTIAVPSGNPGGVTGLADLPRVGVVVCAQQVPCGTATEELFARNGIAAAPVSYEPDARSVLMKIRTDEADAGVVYATDVPVAAGEVSEVAIPPEANVGTAYEAAVVAESPNGNAAEEFVRFLAGRQAQAALAQAGFGAPA